MSMFCLLSLGFWCSLRVLSKTIDPLSFFGGRSMIGSHILNLLVSRFEVGFQSMNF